MTKRFYLILAFIGLVLVFLGVARLLTAPVVITDFPDHLMLVLEEAWEEWRSERGGLGGGLRHITIWNQQEGLHLVEFESRGDTGHAILQEEDGVVEVLAMRSYSGNGATLGSVMGRRRIARVTGWHVPQLQMVVTIFESPKRFYRVEALYYVDGDIKKVEYDADGATRGMVFIEYEHRTPLSATILAYDRYGNQIDLAQ